MKIPPLFERPAELPVSEIRRLNEETVRLQGMNREALMDLFIGDPTLPYDATREAARLLLNREIAPEARHAAIHALIEVLAENISFEQKRTRIYNILDPFGGDAGKVFPFAIQSALDRDLLIAQDSDLQFAFETLYDWNVFNVHQAGEEYEEREQCAIAELEDSTKAIPHAVYRLTHELDECSVDEIRSLLFLLARCDLDTIEDSQIIAIAEHLGMPSKPIKELRNGLSHPGWSYGPPKRV